MTCGVPQGSVLGPLLFILYINDFSKASSVLDLHLFADDSNLFYSNKKLQSIETIVNNKLSKIHEWLCASRLSLNASKTKYVLFHPAKKVVANTISLHPHNKRTSETKPVKCLGVLIDSHLNWKEHIQNLSKKLSKSIGIICKIRHYVSSQILIQLYHAIIYPFLTYGCMVWGNNYITNIKPIEILQKRTIRITTYTKVDAHTTPLFAKLNLLKLQDIITLYIACFMYNYSNSNIPNAFNSFFTAVNKSHTYNTRLASKSSFVFPKVRTNYGKFNIRFFAPKIRNEIEESLKNLSFRIFFNGNSKLIFSVYRILIKNELYIEFCQIMHFVVRYVMLE